MIEKNTNHCGSEVHEDGLNAHSALKYLRMVTVITNNDPYEMQFKFYSNTLDTSIDEILKSKHLFNVTVKLIIAKEK